MVRMFVATTVGAARCGRPAAAAQAPPPTPAADPVITGPIGSPLKVRAAGAADDFPTPRTFPNMPLHDPYVLADETTRTYYLYTQNVASLSGASGGGTMVYRSKNLVNWSDPTKVYAIETDGWARQQNGAWAPEVHKYNGRYYLFTTIHNSQQVIATASTQGQACGNCGQVLAEPDLPGDGDRGRGLADGPVHPARQDQAGHAAQLHDARRHALRRGRQAVDGLRARVDPEDRRHDGGDPAHERPDGRRGRPDLPVQGVRRAVVRHRAARRTPTRCHRT